MAPPDDPAVATDQEGRRHARDRVGPAGGAGLLGLIPRAPEMPDGREPVLPDVAAERVAVVVDADRDERDVVPPRLTPALAELDETLHRFAARAAPRRPEF